MTHWHLKPKPGHEQMAEEIMRLGPGIVRALGGWSRLARMVVDLNLDHMITNRRGKRMGNRRVRIKKTKRQLQFLMLDCVFEHWDRHPGLPKAEK